MDKSLKFKLIKKAPGLFAKDLRTYASIYLQRSLGRARDEKSQKKLDEFYELISSVTDEKFFDMLRSKYRIHFTASSRTPKALLHNKAFLEHVTKYDALSLRSFPDEMIEEKHIKAFVDVIRELDDLSILHIIPLPKKLASSREVVEILYNKTVEKEEPFDYVDVATVIEMVCNSDEAAEYVLERALYTGFLIDIPFYLTLNGNAKNNKKVIEKVLENNVLAFGAIPESAREYAKEIAIKRIRNGAQFDLTYLDGMGLVSLNEMLRDKDIAHELFRLELKRSCDLPISTTDEELMDESAYFSFEPTENMTRLLNKMTLREMSVEDQYIVYKLYTTQYDKMPPHVDTALSTCKDLVDLLIEKEELFSLNTFNITYSTEQLKKITDIYLKKAHDDFYFDDLGEYISNNPEALNYVLEKLETDDNLYLPRVLSRIDRSIYDDEAFEKIYALCKKNSGALNCFLSVKGTLRDDQTIRILDIALEKEESGELVNGLGNIINGNCGKAVFMHILDLLEKKQDRYLEDLLYLAPVEFYYDEDSFDRLVKYAKKRNDGYLNRIVNATFDQPDIIRKFMDKKAYNVVIRYDNNIPGDVLRRLLVEYDDFYMFKFNITNLEQREDDLNYTDIKDLEIVFQKAIEHDDIFLLLRTLKNYQELGIKSELIDSNKEKAINRIAAIADVPGIKEVVPLILSGERKISTFNKIRNAESVRYVLDVGDIESVRSSEYIHTIPTEVYEKINKKHLLKVLSLMGDEYFEGKVMIAINMYLTLGLDKCIELLNPDKDKNYGHISPFILDKLFGNININDVHFKQEGNGYVPETNDELINIIFGKNYKVKNTPMRNYLSNFADRIEQKNRAIEAIKNNLTLTEEQKQERIEIEEKSASKYMKEVRDFIDNIATAFNNWDIIAEEYLKKVANSGKLQYKLNVNVINEISSVVAAKKNIPQLSYRDEPLLKTDIFKYAGYDTQFTVDPQLAPRRAVELSRMMENKHSKKFPDVKLENDGLTLEVYNPQDRDIITAGYKSNCCFRPRGNADDGGKNTSLLTYCCTEEYGGGIKVTDEEGNIVMFSPVLRNGNVLMIHSIETKGMTPEQSRKVHELLVAYAKKTMEIARENGDDISFVAITNLHNFEGKYAESKVLVGNCKFTVLDTEGKYKGMYTNLAGTTQLILASREDSKYPDDIKYGIVEKSYEYEVPKLGVKEVSLSGDETKVIQDMDALNKFYIEASNMRVSLLAKGEKDEAYDLSKVLKAVKKQYLDKYKSLDPEGKRKVEDYYKARESVEQIAKAKGTVVPRGIRQCVYGNGWYITITNDGDLVGDSLDESKEEYIAYLENFKGFVKSGKIYPTGIKKEEIKEEIVAQRTK